MSFDDLAEYQVTCTKENRIMRKAAIFLVEAKGFCTVNGTSEPFEDVHFVYRVGRRFYKDWIFHHSVDQANKSATIYLMRESYVRSVEDLYRRWYDSAESMKAYISGLEVNITRIDEE